MFHFRCHWTAPENVRSQRFALNSFKMPTVEDIPTMDEAALDGPPLGTIRPPVVNPAKDHEEDDEDDEDVDETIVERLIGLSEMFPESVRNVTYGTLSMSIGASKWLYAVGRVGLWVAASSATILALPVMFETERSQMEEQQLAQQRQILLGPNAAVAGGPGAMMPPVPPGR